MPGLKTRGIRSAHTPQAIPVADLTGGLDLRRSQTLMAPDRARTLRNQSLEEPGALIVSPGYTQATSSVVFSGRPQGGGRIYLANAVFTLLAGAGAIYKPSDAWASTGAVHSTLSTSNEIYFPHDRDLVMALDGANAPVYSTNGTTWSAVGLSAPSTAAALSSLSSGGLSSGEYAIAFTVKRGGTAHESNGSSESTITISGSTGAIHAVAGTTSADPTVTAYVWYARHKLPDGESVLRKVSSGAASTVRITSSAWTSNDEIPTNHDVPPVLSYGTAWKSRWWAWDAVVRNRLRFTELFQPQSWPSLYFIDIPFERGDSGAALQAIGDILIAYGQSGLYLVVGQTALDFEVRPSAGSETGAFGGRAWARVEQAALHASADGLATFDGATDRALDADIAPAIRDMVANSAQTSLARIAIVHDALRHQVRMSSPRVYPTGAAGELVLHLDKTRDQEGVPAWTTTDRSVGLYVHWNGNEQTAGDKGRLFFLNSTGGHVFEHSTGTGGVNGSNVTATYEGPGLSLGRHSARYLGIDVDFEPNTGAFSVEVTADGQSQGVFPVSIGTGIFPYGSTITYGTATRLYGSRTRDRSYIDLPLTAEGRVVQVKATYTGQRRFRWFGYAIDVLPESGVRKL